MKGSRWVVWVVAVAAVTLPLNARRLRREDLEGRPQSRPVNFPESIVGRCNLNYDMNSGYIPVTDTDFLFYWHFGPKEEDPQKPTPVIFWTNGGPGCSAMEGAINELGPLSLFKAKDGSALYTGTLSDNPYSWNAFAHLVTVDQPRYVGYSYGSGSRIHSSADAGADMVTFIQTWFSEYPEIPRDSPVFIAGESYAGHYVPAWGQAIMDHNANLPLASTDRINLSGISLGNACVDDSVQVDGAKYLEFLQAARLISPNDHPRTASAGTRMASTHLGYWPNFYDYRIKKVSCTGCYDYDYRNFGDWLLRQDVRTALGICGDAGNDAFGNNNGGCISMGSFDSGVSPSTFTSSVASALDSGIPVVMYFGKCDLACDYVGGMAMASNLRWHGKNGFQNAVMRDLTIAGAAAAQIKGYGGLTWLQIDSAGHMVPADQPAAAFFAIRHLLTNGTAIVSPPPCPPPQPCPICPVCETTSACPTTTNVVPDNTTPNPPNETPCRPPQPCPTCTAPTACPPCVFPPVPESSQVAADDANPVKCQVNTASAASNSAIESTQIVGIAAALGVALAIVSIVLFYVLVSQRCSGGSYENDRVSKRSGKFSINQSNALYKSVLASSDDEDM